MGATDGWANQGMLRFEHHAAVVSDLVVEFPARVVVDNGGTVGSDAAIDSEGVFISNALQIKFIFRHEYLIGILIYTLIFIG